MRRPYPYEVASLAMVPLLVMGMVDGAFGMTQKNAFWVSIGFAVVTGVCGIVMIVRGCRRTTSQEREAYHRSQMQHAWLEVLMGLIALQLLMHLFAGGRPGPVLVLDGVIGVLGLIALVYVLWLRRAWKSELER